MRTIFSLAIILFLTSSSFSQSKNLETVKLGDTQIYYEVYGEGEPLILLHGYTGSSKSWLPYVMDFADKFEVYLIDLLGHEKSGPFKKNFSLKWIAEDVNALLKHLKLSDINAIGYSYGGDVLYQLASINPDLIKSMITIGSMPNRVGTDLFPELIKYFSPENIENLTSLSEHHMNEENIKLMLSELSKYNSSMTNEEIKNIKSKVLIIIGDDDSYVPLEIIMKVRVILKNSDLLALPDSGHGAHKGKHKDFFVKTAIKFFKTE